MSRFLSNYKNLFTSSIFPILLVNFIGVLGYSVVIPILIFIVQDFGGNGFIYGVLGATYPLFQFIGAPILGRLSDRIGRKKVLVISQVGTFIAWCLFLVAFILPETELWKQDSSLTGSYVFTLPLVVIFLARIFDGFTGGNISVANAYLSDVSTDENRSRNFGKMGASTSLGFVIGPAFAGVLAATVLGEILPLIIAALISLVAIFVIRYRLKESKPCVVDTSEIGIKNFRKIFQMEVKDCYVDGEEEYEMSQRDTWKSILKIEGIPVLYAVYFFTFLGFSLFYAAFPVYAGSGLSWSAIDLGLFYAYFSFIMIIVQRPVLNWLSQKTDSATLVWSGAILLAVGFLILSMEWVPGLYIGATIMAFGNGIMWASYLSILSSTGARSRQGAVQGYGSSMGSIANMSGLVLGGLLFENMGTTVFLLGAGIFVLVGILFLINRMRQRESLAQKVTQ